MRIVGNKNRTEIELDPVKQVLARIKQAIAPPDVSGTT
jgi:hypothetical protein